jgi:hypothetical protein
MKYFYFILFILNIITILVKSNKICDFARSGKDYNIEFKGKIKNNFKFSFNGVYDYIFNYNDKYCVGNWILNSSKGDSDYKLVYYGDIKNGKPHGVGQNTMITHNYIINNDTQTQLLYTGSWANGYKEGNGLLYLTFINEKNKTNFTTIQKGKFEKNDIVDGIEFSYTIDNNICSIYTGKFLDNRPNGYSIIHYNNGTILEGEFVNGKIIKIDKIIDSKINVFNCSEINLFK